MLHEQGTSGVKEQQTHLADAVLVRGDPEQHTPTHGNGGHEDNQQRELPFGHPAAVSLWSIRYESVEGRAGHATNGNGGLSLLSFVAFRLFKHKCELCDPW